MVHCCHWTCTKHIEDHVMNKCQAALCYDAKFLNDDQHTTGYSSCFPILSLSYPLPFSIANPTS